MGKNDHVPVPDPKPRVHVPLRKVPTPDYTSSSEPPGSVGRRLADLEMSRERYDAQAVALRNSIVEIATGMANLTRLMKQTSRGVERLAQGHSAGNLGLPSIEEWDGDTTP